MARNVIGKIHSLDCTWATILAVKVLATIVKRKT